MCVCVCVNRHQEISVHTNPGRFETGMVSEFHRDLAKVRSCSPLRGLTNFLEKKFDLACPRMSQVVHSVISGHGEIYALKHA